MGKWCNSTFPAFVCSAILDLRFCEIEIGGVFFAIEISLYTFFHILNDRVIYFLLVLICAFCGTLWRRKQVVTAQVTSLGAMWMMQSVLDQ